MINTTKEREQLRAFQMLVDKTWRNSVWFKDACPLLDAEAAAHVAALDEIDQLRAALHSVARFVETLEQQIEKGERE